MRDQRLSDRLTSYWNDIRGDAEMPDFSRLNSSTISEIWQQCILFTVQHSDDGKSAPTLSFYNIGEKLEPIYGKNLFGKMFSAQRRHFQGANIITKINVMIQRPKPLFEEGEFVNENNKLVKYRSCLLPFGTNGVVTHVVAGLSWKEF